MSWSNSKEFFYEPEVDIDYRDQEKDIRKAIGSDFVWVSEDDPEYYSEKSKLDIRNMNPVIKASYLSGKLSVSYGKNKDGKDRWHISTPDAYWYIAKRINESKKTLSESNSNNVGNLLIGQTVEVKVTDAAGNSSIRSMEVGEIYPASEILVRDPETQDTIVLQFDQSASNNLPNGLVYININPQYGITHQLVISSDLLSNQSITRQVLGESYKNMVSTSNLSRIIEMNHR